MQKSEVLAGAACYSCRKVSFFTKRIDKKAVLCYNHSSIFNGGNPIMKHIKTIKTRNLCESAKKGGCGECQTSCQSACKTSCGIANQQCESNKESK